VHRKHYGGPLTEIEEALKLGSDCTRPACGMACGEIHSQDQIEKCIVRKSGKI